MSRLYLETSALLRILLEGDEALARAVAAYRDYVLSTLTVLEATRAVRRAKRERRIDSVRQRLLLARIRAIEADGHLVAMDDDLLRVAARECSVELVRTLDAIHLAAIASWDEEAGDLDVASVDERIRANVRELGLRLVPRA